MQRLCVWLHGCAACVFAFLCKAAHHSASHMNMYKQRHQLLYLTYICHPAPEQSGSSFSSQGCTMCCLKDVFKSPFLFVFSPVSLTCANRVPEFKVLKQKHVILMHLPSTEIQTCGLNVLLKANVNPLLTDLHCRETLREAHYILFLNALCSCLCLI